MVGFHKNHFNIFQLSRISKRASKSLRASLRHGHNLYLKCCLLYGAVQIFPSEKYSTNWNFPAYTINSVCKWCPLEKNYEWKEFQTVSSRLTDSNFGEHFFKDDSKDSDIRTQYSSHSLHNTKVVLVPTMLNHSWIYFWSYMNDATSSSPFPLRAGVACIYNHTILYLKTLNGDHWPSYTASADEVFKLIQTGEKEGRGWSPWIFVIIAFLYR